MSLINRMLEDLDARNSEGTGGRRGRLSRRGGTARLPWMIAAISLLVAAAVTVAWLVREPPGRTIPAVSASSPSEIATPSDQADQAMQATADVANEPPARNLETSSDAPGKAVAPADESRVAIAAAQDNAPAEPASPQQQPGTSKAAASEVTSPNRPKEKPATEDAESIKVQQEPAEMPPADAGAGELEVSRHLPSPEQAARDQINQGLRAVRAQRYELASSRLAAGLEILPSEDQAREALYVAYRQQGRIAEAEGVLRDGIAVADEPPRFAKLLARELAARDNRSDALKVLAIEVPPVTKDPEYHALRGALLQQEARYAEALPVYEGLVSHYPDNGMWLAGLGMAQEQTGNAAAARNSFQRALRAGGLTVTVKEYVQGRLADIEAATESGE